ncbi:MULTISPECIES: hypothetical protein [unclassified Sinorhizobium]|uniref:DUF7007 domain-containing protein n=1 Tax=unclassified Sinorhizobium TaxID=2613772 RepID=UPI0024C33BC4|nr:MULTISPECIES: hypothetical protein [unclassified Sinorhizobium]MDK1376384.1 hypothetical protein [Sinorhizobium sp. 6-70]MDK1482338.1 hypothetical protein [Sinorhizobium sp. 6-117]
MNTPRLQSSQLSTPDASGLEFGRSADGMAVARVGDLVFAMVPARDGRYFLASAWRVSRSLAGLKRDDFYAHHGSIDGEAAFRDRMTEQAEHRRELGTLGRQTVRLNCSTPWGSSQGATVYADGIVSHTTAGHGGFKLSAARNAKVHPMLRADSGWYEEDAAWAIVALTFRHLFTTYERKCADNTIRDSWPEAWEMISDRSLAPGESYEKDRRVFAQEHAGDWIVTAALRSDHRPGMTEVIATIGGNRSERAEARRFLVPSDDYAVGRFGFVIDEAKHASYDGPSSFACWRGRAA